MREECISVACPRCGLTFTDFINSELRAKLDSKNAELEGFKEGVKDGSDRLKAELKQIEEKWCAAQVKLDIAVEELGNIRYELDANYYPNSKMIEMIDSVLKKLEAQHE